MTKFEELLSLNVNDKTEKKNGLTYLSWAWAWAEFVKVYQDATYKVVKNENGMPYFKDESGAFCYTEITAGGVTHEMWLPVMNNMNKAILQPNAFEINKTIMRCLAKNLAMFGLGLYIYAGEDLPEPSKEELENKVLEIEKLISTSGTDKDKFLAYFKVDSIEKLPYDKAIQALQAKLAKEAA